MFKTQILLNIDNLAHLHITKNSDNWYKTVNLAQCVNCTTTLDCLGRGVFGSDWKLRI